jgi:hypothetical protein
MIWSRDCFIGHESIKKKKTQHSISHTHTAKHAAFIRVLFFYGGVLTYIRCEGLLEQKNSSRIIRI